MAKRTEKTDYLIIVDLRGERYVIHKDHLVFSCETGYYRPIGETVWDVYDIEREAKPSEVRRAIPTGQGYKMVLRVTASQA